MVYEFADNRLNIKKTTLKREIISYKCCFIYEIAYNINRRR